MPFVSRPGLNGKVYVPEKLPGQKKHDCKACFSCQACGDDRCSLCLNQDGENMDCGRAVIKSTKALSAKNTGISI